MANIILISTYRRSYVMKELDRLEDNPTIPNLLTMIKHLTDPSLSLEQLHEVLEQKAKDYGAQNLQNVIQFICTQAKQIKVLFPNFKLRKLTQGNKVSFTGSQAVCLLASWFLGAIDYFPEQFTVVFWFNERRKPSQLYLHALLEYFFWNAKGDEYRENITFERLCQNNKVDWSRDETILMTNVNICTEGSIGDRPEEIEVDFANARLGGGTGGSQEDILFGTSPGALLISMISRKPMGKDEAIVITGANKFAAYTGFGSNVMYTGPYEDKRKERKIIAIDALEYHGSIEESRKEQLKEENLEIECTKASIGFAAANGQTLGTGHWGCGAFKGDKEVKAMVQIMAASVAGVKSINYYCFGDKDFEQNFSNALQVMQSKQLKVRDLWNILTCNQITNQEFQKPLPFLFSQICS